jgi:hypothetical protein
MLMMVPARLQKRNKEKRKGSKNIRANGSPNYQWCRADDNDKYGAKCILCGISFSIAGSGIGQVSFERFHRGLYNIFLIEH